MAGRTLESIAPYLAENPEGTLDDWWTLIDRNAERLSPWAPGAAGDWRMSMLNSMIQRQVRLLTHIHVSISFMLVF